MSNKYIYEVTSGALHAIKQICPLNRKHNRTRFPIGFSKKGVLGLELSLAVSRPHALSLRNLARFEEIPCKLQRANLPENVKSASCNVFPRFPDEIFQILMSELSKAKAICDESNGFHFMFTTAFVFSTMIVFESVMRPGWECLMEITKITSWANSVQRFEF